MAKKKKDLLSRLADAGEDAINRLGDAPGMDRLTQLAGRLDDLQKRVRGIDELEKRLAKVERQVAALSGTTAAPKPKPKPKTTAPKTGPASPS